ncbi:MAG TPA: TIR domain-containing protein [Xanthobacteraceae bacterium]|nr:TIR domain-containing protein [Xanthobacteraceae bacterium]
MSYDSGNPPLFVDGPGRPGSAVTTSSPYGRGLAEHFLADAGRMPFDVFISYSVEDKLTAQAVCATLESNGVRCWIAPRDITPGSEYGDAIVEAINHSRALVLVFSSNANQSPQIRREVERAVSKGLPIVPLRIEDIAPTQSLEYFIGAVHWLDALTPPLEHHLQRLAEAVKALLRIDSPDTAGAPAGAPIMTPVQRAAAATTIPTAGKPVWHRNRITLGAVGACLALIALGAVWYLRSASSANAAECERLWIKRNSFYKSHGLCFATQRAKAHFDNTGCTYNDQDYVYEHIFSDTERTQVQDIRNEEKARGCL